MSAAPPSSAISPETLSKLGLRQGELDLILKALGRDPNPVELAIYSAMWSEHCAYKHSRALLKRFPTNGGRVVAGPGENAGALDIGDGLCVVFKMESHNHPSAVEPYEGAATGVGGILRDVFAMGARPVALLDNLRFGPLGEDRMERLVDGVIEGVAGYGNCVGVPTVGGDVSFDEGYRDNILVNVMAVGVAPKARLTRGRASRSGGSLLCYGAPTGRDGLHGAAFASAALSEASVERRSAVQVGDPFMGKKAMEATLELIERGLVDAVQDMGAAGLTCSTCELAGREGLGVELDLDRAPRRADGMSAIELLLSESQERMLAVVPPENVERALATCSKWECGGAIVGRIAGSGRVEVRMEGRVVADLPARSLTADAPVYLPASAPPPPADPIPSTVSLEVDDANTSLLELLRSPEIASKRWIYGRYDHQVRGDTISRPGDADAAVVRVKGDGQRPDKFLALASGCDQRLVARDARLGGQLAIMDVARRLACVGAEPIGFTNCLNFGSPERPEIFGALELCVEGMADACRALGAPITGGNVSLYNERGGVAAPSTPMVGGVGLVESLERVLKPGFSSIGDVVLLIGGNAVGIGGSQWAVLRGMADRAGEAPLGGLPGYGLDADLRLVRFLLQANRLRLLRSAKHVARGGAAVALAKCRVLSPIGLGVRVDELPGASRAEALFGETPRRVLATASSDRLDDLLKLARSLNVPCERVGEVWDKGFRLPGERAMSVEELRLALARGPVA